MNNKISSTYSDVDVLISRIDNREVSRKTLEQQKSRFKAQGRHEEVAVITEALERTKNPALGIARQGIRLSETIKQIDADDALAMKIAVCQFARNGAALQASLVMAYQNLFSAKGCPMSHDEVMAYLMLEAAGRFEEMAGELPIIVD